MSGAAEGGQDQPLRDYTRARQSLAQTVQTLGALCRRSNSSKRATACRDLLVKLAEDRFTLAVVGQFKRGKSSLMNALLGRELLPTGVLPVTSAITVLRYGPDERLLLARTDSKLLEEADLSRLAEFVTETGNPGNRQGVSAVYVELPHPFLRRGLEFVDTPGVGSVIEANTATTYAFLPQCDAVVFVTSADTPLTAAETGFLRDLGQHLRKVFVVLNKIDLAPPAERQTVRRYVETTLSRELGVAGRTCFPVSSRCALEAERAGNREALNESGVPALKEALGRFLATERQSVLLEAVADKALRLCTDELRETRWMQHLQSRKTGEGLPARKARAFAELRRKQEEALAALGRQLHDRLRAHVVLRWNAFAGRLASLLADEVRAELDRRRREQAVTAVHWTAVRVEARLKAEVTRWWEEQQPALTRLVAEAGDSAAAELWQRPIEVVATLSGAPAMDEAPVPPDEHLFPGVSWLPPGHIRWAPTVPGLLKPLPVGLCKGKLTSLLAAQLPACLNDAAHLVERAADRSLEHTLHGFETDLRDHTEALEERGQQALAPDAPGTGLSEAETGVQLAALRDALLKLVGRQAPAASPETPADLPPRSAAVAPEDRIDFRRALATRGCALCDALETTTFEFFSRFQYDLATSADIQRSFAETAGFCPGHTWQLAGVSSPSGMSRGLALWAEQTAAALTALRADSLSGEAATVLDSPAAECRVCSLLRATEAALLPRLAAFVQTPAGRRVYEESQGLCLSHLAGLLHHVSADDSRAFLLGHAVRTLETLVEDMRSYALKHDAVRRALVNRDERDAWLRTLVHLKGARNLHLPWGDGPA